MSLVLNGTSQYVSLGDAVDIRSATPILIACVVDTTGLPSATRGLYSQGDYSASTGHGAFAYGGPPKSQGNYGAPSGGSTGENDLASSIPADDGWYLIVWAVYTTGSAPNIAIVGKVQAYSYDHATWTTQDSGSVATGLSTTTLQSPSAGQTTVIGANLIGTIHNFWPTKYSWIAVFNNDGGGGGTQIKDTAIAAELIANGFWNLLDSNCKLAIAFNATTTTDQSGNGHTGTLVGSPSYGATGPGELAPGGGGTTYNDAGGATSAATVSAADNWTMADAGQAPSAWSSGALDTMAVVDAGAGVLVALASGVDVFGIPTATPARLHLDDWATVAVALDDWPKARVRVET